MLIGYLGHCGSITISDAALSVGCFWTWISIWKCFSKTCFTSLSFCTNPSCKSQAHCVKSKRIRTIKTPISKRIRCFLFHLTIVQSFVLYILACTYYLLSYIFFIPHFIVYNTHLLNILLCFITTRYNSLLAQSYPGAWHIRTDNCIIMEGIATMFSMRMVHSLLSLP